MKILEYPLINTKIMKFIEFHVRIMKILFFLIIPHQNHEHFEIHKIQLQNPKQIKKI